MALNFKTFSHIIFYLFPLCLISGPLLPEIISLLIIIYFLITTINEKKNFLYENNFFKLLIVISLFIFVRNFFSDYFSENYLSSIFYFRFTIFALGIYSLDLTDRSIKIFFFYGILTSFIVLFFDASYEYLFKDRIFGLNSSYSSRISSFFGDEYIMGSFIIRLLPLLIFSLLWIDIKETNFILSLYLILLMATILIVLSGERTALLLLFIMFSFFILLKRFRAIFFINLIFILLLFITILQNQDYKNRYLGFINKNTNESTQIIFYTAEHHSMMLTSVKIIKANFILGSGSKSFKHLCKMDEFKTITYPSSDIGNEDIGCSTHPHNIFLQIFVEYGLVGICLYLLIFYKIISKIHLNILQYNRSNLNLFKNASLSLSFLYLALFLNIFPFIPSGNFFNNWLSIILFLPIGFILSIEKK